MFFFPDEIDKINILNASFLAIISLDQIDSQFQKFIIVDGQIGL